jgi:hypothetical protein
MEPKINLLGDPVLEFGAGGSAGKAKKKPR